MSLVTIGCKIPSGLILEMGYDAVPGGTIRGPNYKAVTLRGPNMHHIPGAPAPANFVPGLTHNVDEEFFDAWMKSHQDSNIVKNKLVFKAKSKAEAEAKALDATAQTTGMEPLNPNAVSKAGVEKAVFAD